MRRKSDYDPGAPYDPPPYRRRRQRHGEQDDAWAAADEDDFYDDDVEIEDLAAGYVDPDQDPRWREDDPDWSPPLRGRRMRGRRRGGHPSAQRSRHDRADVYPDSPTYHRDRANRGEYGEYWEKPKRGPADSYFGIRGTAGIPFWQILIVVILAIFALMAMGLACASILML